ncbi:hypothetical protein BDY17DRAFT_294308 [Neohortaea acidophila]|uniref:Amidohydrolase-related domain-containing protein n=1 Tax=Neohortaea acidophila TaxID=245834 RepID=A0A6A6Q1G5_9PEZI|nr:uncharacterized protein BDY17DRAFT_294308 [Neohortaea acidophila]KAF2485834.1 hypothetical protein BDY17DRAFT_294308 [Neohortaea acidophila]
MHRYVSAASLFLYALPSSACPGHYRRGENGTAIPQTYQVQTRIKPATPTATVAITNVRVWDGYKVNEPSTVYIAGDSISGVQSTVDQSIDGRNGILLPGLIDAHAHPGSVQDLETLSSYGVTTVLNQNCQNYEYCSSMRGQTGLTSFFTAGFSAKGPGSSHANNSDTPLDKLIWEPSQAPAYVQYVFGNGSDWLKVVSEQNGPDQATQNALVENAHALGKKVNTHCSLVEFYNMAILSKSDGPQHIPMDGVLNDTMLDLMYSQKQYATPTMNVFYDQLHDPAAVAALGQPAIPFEEAWSVIKQNVAAVYAKGIPVLAGTDSTTPYAGLSVSFGNSLHYELWHLYQAGLPTEDILRAATILPALHHGLPHRGAIEEGMLADLVLLEPDADPIQAINDTMKISRVWIGGLEYMNVAK